MSSTPKVRPVTHPVVFTANRLRDGRVVWLTAAGEWSERIAAAACFPPDTTEAAQALAKQGEQRQEVVGAYAVEVSQQAGTPRPLKFRERLRIAGPSVAAAPALALAS